MRLLKLLKKLPSILQQEVKNKEHLYSQINIYFQDESRFGLFTRNGRALTARGVKPICQYLHKFQNTYLFGAFSPVTGDHFILDLPECNSQTFQIFLDELSKENHLELKIIFLDNGAFHKAKRLSIPDNIVLIFLPPYSPELNPAEKVWWVLKREINRSVFRTLEELQKELYLIVKRKVYPEAICSLTGYHIFLNAFRTIINV